jgi:quinol monooxygenase YgiN
VPLGISTCDSTSSWEMERSDASKRRQGKALRMTPGTASVRKSDAIRSRRSGGYKEEMAETVAWLIELEVKPGALEGFRMLTQEMVEATRAESGAKIYERFMSNDGAVVHLYERYADSAAALNHLRRFREMFAERLLSVVDRKRVTVYGAASTELRAALDALGPDYLSFLDGFAR